jgi:hypothetical protein
MRGFFISCIENSHKLLGLALIRRCIAAAVLRAREREK